MEEEYEDSPESLIAAAGRGDLYAMHQLGARYATGEGGCPKDEAEAVRWYTKAADLGHDESQYDLGFMVLLGEGTEKDVEKALWWLEQAAQNGYVYAARLLYDLYS